MKGYIKKLFLRIIILFALTLVILFIIEFISSLSKEKREYIAWKKENEVINNMNIDKLQNKDWNYNPLWLHEGEELKPKGKNIKRVLIVGDSFIWGDGCSNANQIWWQQFRQLLKQNGYQNVEVVAAGVGGYSTKQEFENIFLNKELMSSIDPDLIIIGYVSNDTEFRNENDETYIKAANSNDLLYGSNNWLVKKFKKMFPFTYRSINTLLYNKFENNSRFQEYFGVSYNQFLYDFSSGNWLTKYEKEVLIPLKKYIEEELNIPFFFYLTSTYKEDPALHNIMSTFRKNDINYYFSVNYFYNKSFSELYISPANFHPSIEVYQEFANGLLKIMEENYSDILGTKKRYYPEYVINDWMPYSLKPVKINNMTYEINYPEENAKNSFLYLPIEKKYVKLNLEDPYYINNITITGNNIETIEVFVNKKSYLEYDNRKMISLGKKSENFTWHVGTNDITSINISAKIKDGKSEKLTIVVD